MDYIITMGRAGGFTDPSKNSVKPVVMGMLAIALGHYKTAVVLVGETGM